mgnify:CR=1 FL=1
MALDNAIKNVGDYYAAHYLADKNGFAKDISEQAKAWKEAGSQSTPRKLAALSTSYFKAKTEALGYPEPLLRAFTVASVIESGGEVFRGVEEASSMDLVQRQRRRRVDVLARFIRHALVAHAVDKTEGFAH